MRECCERWGVGGGGECFNNVKIVINAYIVKRDLFSLIEHYKNVKNQAIYGVVHGGVSKEIRSQSLEYLSGLPFDGFAVGGSLGGNREEMKEMLEYVMGEYRVIEETKFGRR